MVSPPGRVSLSVYEDKRLDRTGLRPLLPCDSTKLCGGRLGAPATLIGRSPREAPAMVL